MTERTTVIERIERYRLPKIVVAKLAGVYPQDISMFVGGLKMSEERARSIAKTVAELVSFIRSLSYPPDMRNVDLLRDALGSHRLDMIRKYGSHAADDWNLEDAGRVQVDETN